MFKKIKEFLLNNTSVKQTIVKNTFWLFLSDVAGRLLRMGLIIYAARTLGVDGWGVFSYATSIGIILMTFSDIGLSGIINREAIQKKEGYKTFISTAIALKITLVVLSIAILLILGPLMSNIPETKGLFLLIAMISFFDSLRELCFFINRAFEKMEREMYIRTIMNITILILGILFLRIEASPKSMALAYMIGSAVGFLGIVILASKDLFSIFSKIEVRLFKDVLKVSWPFAIVTLVSILIANIDTYMLGIWKNSFEIGLYTSVQRIYSFAAVIPSIIAPATFPIMSRLANVDKEKFRLMLEKTLSILLLFAVPIAIGGSLLGREIILLVFGPTYIEAIPIMVTLMLMILLSFPFAILSNAVFAYNTQRALSLVYIAGIILNVVLNIFLIPKFGAIGASIATLFSTALMTIIIWIEMKKLNYFEILPTLKNIIPPVIIMTLCILLLKFFSIGVVINISISSIIYISSLFLFEEPMLKEIKEIINLRT